MLILHVLLDKLSHYLLLSKLMRKRCLCCLCTMHITSSLTLMYLWRLSL